MSVTGRVWLRQVSRRARKAQRNDPELHAALVWARNEVLDAAARGDIDLALPLHLEDLGDGRVHVSNFGRSA